MNKELVMKVNESINIITPYGEIRLTVNERDQRGNEKCVSLNTAFEEMYFKSNSSNDVNIFITKNDRLTQKRVESFYENKGDKDE